MIPASELRIGNYIQFKELFLKIKGCESDDTSYKALVVIPKSGPLLVPIERIEPIQLTPELLKKAGFKKHISSDRVMEHYFKGDIIFLSRVKGTDEFYIEHYRPSSEKVEVKSVHQLQNLYFALTSHEIEINL
jgi:hypothetical protein